MVAAMRGVVRRRAGDAVALSRCRSTPTRAGCGRLERSSAVRGDRYRDPGEGDGARMLEMLWNFSAAVSRTWPEGWELPPRKSRLTHGVGIVDVMDEVADRLWGGATVPSEHDDVAVWRSPCVCAWTRGQWEFGLREHRPWNELQVTSKDIMKLADLLLGTHRSSRVADGRRSGTCRGRE